MNAGASSTILLVRTTLLDDRVLAFADTLSAASGHPVSFVLDERHGAVPPHGRSVVGITDARCRALGLHCPSDYAWRCGDYGYYLARQQFPDAKLLWMIEYDVRFAGDRLADFFAFFAARPHIDLLATGFEEAGWEWYWSLTARGRHVRPFRCLFPVTRLSSRAVDALRAKRVDHSGRLMRRLLWPNDEALVATTLGNGAFDCRDFNSFGRAFYDPATFTFTNPINGDTFDDSIGETRMVHPVLYGVQYEEKLRKLRQIAIPRPAWQGHLRRVTGRVNSFLAW